MSIPLILRPLRRTVIDAEAFARAAHGEQKDKAGEPYIRHLVRVVGRTSAKLAGLPAVLSSERVCELLQIAWLHDVIEETPYGSEHLRKEGFSERVVQGTFALSNRSKVPYPAGLSEIPCLGGGLHIRPPWPG